MPTPQPAIFREDTPHHYVLEFRLRPGWNADVLRHALQAALASRVAESNILLAFGRDAWERLAPEAIPDDFISFHAVLGRQDRTAPDTQGDLLFWLHGERHDLNLECAFAIGRALAHLATLEIELHGFTYLDSRDLTGFVNDHTNPRGDAARSATLIRDGMVGAGGSFVLTQQWVHELERFRALAREEQEAVIGRDRAAGHELDDAPATAHARRVEINVDGEELKIYRRSVPWGGLRQHGTYFLAFSREIMVFAMQLDRMFGRAEDGLLDRLTEFSTPISGSYWYAPSLETLHAAIGCTTE